MTSPLPVGIDTNRIHLDSIDWIHCFCFSFLQLYPMFAQPLAEPSFINQCTTVHCKSVFIFTYYSLDHLFTTLVFFACSDPNPNSPPLEQRVSPTSCVGAARLMWSTNCSWSLLYTAWQTTWHAGAHWKGAPLYRVTCVRPLERSTTVKFLESPTLASQGPVAPFCAIGIYIVEHHPRTRLNSGHGSDTTWRT